MSVTIALEELLRQARRLRFDEAEREARFWHERVDALIVRSRVMIVAGLVMVVLNGVMELQILERITDPDRVAFYHHSLGIRAGVLMPAWLAMLVSTFLPGHRQRADRLNGTATVLGLGALVLIRWLSAQVAPERPVVGPMVGDLALVSVLSVMTLPMTFRRVAVWLSLWAAAALALFAVIFWADRQRELLMILVGLGTTVGTSLLFLWRRETDDRVIFVQREHVESLNAELAARNAELTTLNEEKSEFMAIAAHDLRAPLASVRGFAELLRDGRLRDEAKRQRAIEQIAEQSARMLKLVSDYLGSHAAESGALDLRIQNMDVAAALGAAVERHAASATAKAQTLNVESEAGPAAVAADEAALAQVLDNYLSNAVKFSPRGGAIRLRWQVAGDRVRLEVADRGPGIAAEEQDRLFRKFSRASSRPTAGEDSHGLGLAVVKRLVQAMRGTVGCDSTPGTGAVFWVELPAACDQV